MQVHCSASGSCLIVRLSGEMDHHSCDAIRHLIDDEYHQNGALHIIFDCKDIHFVDSSGLGLIMGRYRLASSLGGHVMAVNVSPQLDRILAMSGLYKLIQKMPDTATAVKMLEGGKQYV